MKISTIIKIALFITLLLAMLSCTKEVVKIQPQLQYQGIDTGTVDYGAYQPSLQGDFLRNGVPHYIGGTHLFWPSSANIPISTMEGYMTFTSDYPYDLNNVDDQFDFNKNPGGMRKSAIGGTQKNYGTWANRWCIEHQRVEHSPYLNDQDGGFWCFDHSQVIAEQLSCPLNVPVYFKIQNFTNRFEFTIGDRWYVFYKLDYNLKEFSTAYYVNGYFGGNHVAPHDIHIILNYIIFLFIRKRKELIKLKRA